MTEVLDKLDRLTVMAERMTGLMDKIPRLAEMLGIALFAGRASERLGGRFTDGAIAGVVADGLAHSQLPNNQIGGIALGAYMSAIGLLNLLPNVVGDISFPDPDYTAGGTVISPEQVGLGARHVTVTGPECFRLGGTVIQAIINTPYVVCQLPPEE